MALEAKPQIFIVFNPLNFFRRPKSLNWEWLITPD